MAVGKHNHTVGIGPVDMAVVDIEVVEWRIADPEDIVGWCMLVFLLFLVCFGLDSSIRCKENQ